MEIVDEAWSACNSDKNCSQLNSDFQPSSTGHRRWVDMRTTYLSPNFVRESNTRDKLDKRISSFTHHTAVSRPDDPISLVPISRTSLLYIQLSNMSTLHVIPECKVTIVVVPVFCYQPRRGEYRCVSWQTCCFRFYFCRLLAWRET